MDAEKTALIFSTMNPLYLNIPSALILSDNEPREIVYNGAQKHQKDVDGFTPCVEYQRKDDQHRVFVFDTAGSRISDKA